MSSYSAKLEKYALIKRTMLDLIADLQQIFNQSAEEEDDMIKVNLYFKDMHPESAFNHVAKYIIPHKKKILSRDLIFFLENGGIFSGLPEDKVRYYSRQITSQTRLASEDKDAIWDYLEVIIVYTESIPK